MNLRSCNLINLLFNFMLIFDVVLMGAYPVVKGTVIESYLMYLLWGITFGILFFSIVADFGSGFKSGFMEVICLIALLIYDLLISPGNKASMMIASLNFFVMFFPFYYSQHMEYAEYQVKAIEFCGIAKSLIFIIYYFSPFAYSGFYGDGQYLQNGQLTLGYSNPNSTAIYLFNTFLLLFYLFTQKKEHSKMQKLGMLMILLSLCYLIICTQSRLEIGCVGIVVLLRFFGSNDKIKQFLTSRVFVLFVVILPLLFLWGYFKLFEIFPYGFSLMGRDIFSRILIYKNVLQSVSDYFWLGNLGEWLFNNSHNGLLTILANIGFIGMLIYLLYILGNISRYAKYVKKNKNANIIAYFMIITFLLQACVEAVSLTGGVSYATSIAVATYLSEANKSSSFS